jgi:tRNA-modifying protein YgfZ
MGATVRRMSTSVVDPSRCILRVTGSDRVTWLNSLATCELKNAAAGIATYGLFVNRVGKIQADAWFCIGADFVDVALPREVAKAMVATLESHLIMENVELALDETQTLAFGEGAYKTARGPYIGAVQTVPFKEATSAEHAAWLTFRLTYGFPEFGTDFDRALLPHEASLDRDAVSFQKGCYLGQEVVCMVELRGQVNKKLVLLESETQLAPGSPVQTASGEGGDIGTVKSTGPFGTNARSFALLKRVPAENETSFRTCNQTAQKVTLAIPSVPPPTSA